MGSVWDFIYTTGNNHVKQDAGNEEVPSLSSLCEISGCVDVHTRTLIEPDDGFLVRDGRGLSITTDLRAAELYITATSLKR